MKPTVLLGMVLSTLSSCHAKGVPMNLHSAVTTPHGGIVQKLTVKGRRAEFYTFSRSANKGSEGTFTLSDRDIATPTRLSAGLKDYTCPPSTAADNQAIAIAVQGVHLRCTEARMEENRAVGQLIQAIRKLIGSHLR